MANSIVIDDVRNCVSRESCRTLLVIEVYVGKNGQMAIKF